MNLSYFNDSLILFSLKFISVDKGIRNTFCVEGNFLIRPDQSHDQPNDKTN